MTTPQVTEVRRRLEPVSPDPFVDDLEDTARANERRADGRRETPEDDRER